MKIFVSSICFNEADMVRPWIEHLLAIPQVEYIHLLDTGSTDRTTDYIEEYKNVAYTSINKSNGIMRFADMRNIAISSVSKLMKDDDWLLMLDIDELFSANYLTLFEHLNSLDLSKYNTIRFPHIKSWDFDTLWFHNNGLPGLVPGTQGPVYYSTIKDTIALFRKSHIDKFVGDLHEQLKFKDEEKAYLASFLKKSVLDNLNELQDDVFAIHYSKAKAHAASRRTGRSFEYYVGLKRVEYRKIQALVYEGKKYDYDWAIKATDKEIEELGRAQLKRFINEEGHNFPTLNFDPYELNNDSIKKYFPRESLGGNKNI